MTTVERSDIYFSHEVRVRYSHTDSIGVTFFANYLVFFDNVLIEFFRSKGITFTPKAEIIYNGEIYTGQCWVISEATCKYLAPSTYDDLLEIEVDLKDLQAKRVTFSFRCQKN